jgi:hypothetical protein
MKEMVEKYHMIMGNIVEARRAGDMKTVKMWRGRLEKWQKEYGACAPV